MSIGKTYNSKVLLFGEYTVLHGSKALAMPFRRFYGEWKYDKAHSSRQEINILKQYLLSIHRAGEIPDFDFDDLERHIAKGLAFESNIPQGYGVGSSGSVTAAVYDVFYKYTGRTTVNELKNTLGRIESCYHGSSSGVDPLVSYLGQPILLHSKTKVELLDSVNENVNNDLYLIDTGIKRSTAPLVEAYLATRRKNELFLLEMQKIAEINDDLIDSYLINDHSHFVSKLKELSAAQYQVMKMLIPDPFKVLWKQGLESGDYTMKLNGAGGGGFLMVMKHNHDVLFDQGLIPIG